MKLRPEEITSILRERIEQYDVETDLAEVGTVLQIGDGIARVYGLENAGSLEMLEFEHGVTGLAFNLEEDDVGVALFGEWEQGERGRAGATHRPGGERPGRRGAARPGRRPARQPARRARRDRRIRDAAARVQGAGRDRAPAGEGAAPDRHQGDRRDDERRPRPARAHHRRPLDRQDRDPDRHDPQPARHGRALHLRRDRPEGLDRRRHLRAAARGGRDGVHDDRLRRRARGRADQVDGAVRRLRDGRVLPLQGQARARPVRRPLEARGRVPPALAAAAPAAGPRGVPGRRLLSPLAAARARLQAQRGEGRRLADRPADHRDAGGRRVGVHPDERDLDHRRADLPPVGALLLRASVRP